MNPTMWHWFDWSAGLLVEQNSCIALDKYTIIVSNQVTPFPFDLILMFCMVPGALFSIAFAL